MHINTKNPPKEARGFADSMTGFIPASVIPSINIITTNIMFLNHLLLNTLGIFLFIEMEPIVKSRKTPLGQSQPHQNLPKMGERSIPPNKMNPIKIKPMMKRLSLFVIIPYTAIANMIELTASETFCVFLL